MFFSEQSGSDIYFYVSSEDNNYSRIIHIRQEADNLYTTLLPNQFSFWLE